MPFAAATNPDILHWDQAMKAPDRDKFIEAVRTELDGHEKNGQLRARAAERSARRHQTGRHGVVYATKEKNQNTRSI